MWTFLWGLQGDLVTVPPDRIAAIDRAFPRPAYGFYWALCRELARIRLKTEFSVLYNESIAENSSSPLSDLDVCNNFAYHFQFVCAEKGDIVERSDVWTKMDDFGEPPLRVLIGTTVDKAAQGDYSLLTAAGLGRLATTKLLIEVGVDLEHRDRYNRTALLWAVIGKKMNPPSEALREVAEDQTDNEAVDNEAIVKVLLEAGADIEATDNRGLTALFHTAFPSTGPASYPTLKLLIGAGANIEAKGPDGDTPLLRSVNLRRYMVALILLEAGADVLVFRHRLYDGRVQYVVGIILDQENINSVAILSGLQLLALLDDHPAKNDITKTLVDRLESR